MSGATRAPIIAPGLQRCRMGWELVRGFLGRASNGCARLFRSHGLYKAAHRCSVVNDRAQRSTWICSNSIRHQLVPCVSRESQDRACVPNPADSTCSHSRHASYLEAHGIKPLCNVYRIREGRLRQRLPGAFARRCATLGDNDDQGMFVVAGDLDRLRARLAGSGMVHIGAHQL